MPPKNREGLYWSPQDDECLRAYGNDIPLGAIAFMLGRSYRAVAQRRTRLDIARQNKGCKPVPVALVLSLAEHFAAEANCTAEQVLGSRRIAPIAWARQQVMKALRAEYSLYAIGRVLGVDHTTVVYGVSRADRPCPVRKPREMREHPKRPFEKIKARSASVRLIANHPPKPPKAVVPPSGFTISKSRLMAGR